MGIHIFKLPDIGEGTAEAELVAWHVAVGDLVEEEQPVADVMTDKATVELTAPVAGRIRALHGQIGELSQVGSPLIEFDTEAGGEAQLASDLAPPYREKATPGEPVLPASPPQANGAGRPKTTPAVRARAAHAGVDLHEVSGSGPQGRIRQADLEAFLGRRQAGDAPKASPPQAAARAVEAEYRDVKLTGLRRKIAEKMEQSSRQIPHFSYIEEVDVTELEDARAALNARYGAEKGKLNFLPFLIQAMCRVLADYAPINATYDEPAGTVRYHAAVHVGIATQTSNGLVVPVVRDAESLGLWELAQEIARLASAARDGTARREELSGSTITITSLGTLGGLATTPVINAPEVAIIGPNRIVERPMARGGGVVLRKMMNISSSFDHRIVDGHDAALFIQELRTLLENPPALLAR